MKPNREKLIRDGTITLSVSQIDSADPVTKGCYRKQFFKSILKLPVPPFASTTFGSVLHEVCERYLKADDMGTDPETGQPVELYPPEWDKPTDRWGNKEKVGITEKEKAQVKSLIKSSIESGMLTRVPGREIEKEIRYTLCDHEGVQVDLIGYIDLFEPDAIIDHKTSSNKAYMKSIAKLKKNTQLVTYAYVLYEKGELDKTKSVWLRHNYYVKDKKTGALHTEPRQVEITYKEAKKYVEERVIPVARQIVENTLSIDHHSQIPMPSDVGACKMYGGCSFSRVCSGGIEYEKYLKKFEAVHGKKESKKTESKEKKMAGIMDKFKKQEIKSKKVASSKSDGAADPAKEPETKKAEVPKEEPKAAPTPVTDDRPKAPWAQDGCSNCGAEPVAGIKGEKVCFLCNPKAKKKGINPDDYQVHFEEDMIFILDSAGEVVLEYVPEDEPVSTGEKSQAITERPEPEVIEEPEPAVEEPAVEEEPEVVEEPEPEAEAEEAPKPEEVEESSTEETDLDNFDMDAFRDSFEESCKARGKGLLLIGCAFIEGQGGTRAKIGAPSSVLTGTVLMKGVKHLLMQTPEAKRASKNSKNAIWEELDTWARKDLISAYAHKIADFVGNSTVQVRSLQKATDLYVVVEALSPYMRVIQALSE